MNNYVNNVNNHFTHIENNYNVFNRGGWDRFAYNWNNNNYWGSWHNTRPYYGDWYHGCWHGNYGSGWGYAAGLATGALVSSWTTGPTIYDSGYYTYSNPYYTEPLVVGGSGGAETVINYSQPLQVTVNSAPEGEEPAPPLPPTAVELLDEARTLFAEQNYGAALSKTHEVLAVSPNDPIAHQLRALILFATGDYRQAAATLYAILAVGPPWDWTTMSGLYADTDIYAKQFAQLEKFVEDNPNAGYAHFLLGYHYMVCGYNEEAIDQFQRAHELEPSDQLATSMIRMLGGTPSGEEAAPEIEPPADDDAPLPEVDPKSLFGSWKSQRASGPAIELTLSEDGNFEWRVQQGADLRTLSGEYSLGADKIALQPKEGSPMMATISNVQADGFQFRVVGAPPGDKGLEFVRQ